VEKLKRAYQELDTRLSLFVNRINEGRAAAKALLNWAPNGINKDSLIVATMQEVRRVLNLGAEEFSKEFLRGESPYYNIRVNEELQQYRDSFRNCVRNYNELVPTWCSHLNSIMNFDRDIAPDFVVPLLSSLEEEIRGSEFYKRLSKDQSLSLTVAKMPPSRREAGVPQVQRAAFIFSEALSNRNATLDTVANGNKAKAFKETGL